MKGVRAMMVAGWRAAAAGVVRYPVTVLAIALVLSVLAVVSLLRLTPDPTLTALLARDVPAARAMAQMHRDFRMADELLLVASLPEDAPVQDRARLSQFAQKFATQAQATAERRQRIRQVRYGVGQDDDEPRFVREVIVPALLLYLDDDGLAQALARLEPEAMQAQLRRNHGLLAAPGPAGGAVAAAVLRDPLRLQELAWMPGGLRPNDDTDLWLSHDGRSLLIRVSGARPATDLDFTAALLADVTAIAQDANDDGLVLAFGGAYAIASASHQAIRGDMIVSVTGSVVLIQLLLLLFYRRLLSLPLMVLPVAVAIVVAFGLFALGRQTLTPITAVIGAVLAGLGVDYCVHLLSAYEKARGGKTPSAAALQALLDVAPRTAAATATTVIGFAAIAQSQVVAVRDFSLLGMMGLIAALAASLTVLPALLVLTDRRLSVYGPDSFSGDAELPCREGEAPAQPPDALKHHFQGTAQRELRPPMRKVALPPGNCQIRVRRTAGPQDRWMSFLLRGLLAHRRTCVALTITLTAVALLVLSAASLPSLEADLTAMHPRPNPALDLQRELSERFGHGEQTMFVLLEADGDAALLRLAHEVHSRLQAAGVQGRFGPAALLPDPAQVDERLQKLATIDPEKVRADFQAAVEASPFNPQAYRDYADALPALLRPRAPQLADLRAYATLADMMLAEPGAEPTALVMVEVAGTQGSRVGRDQAIAQLRTALAGLDGATLTGMGVLGHDTERTIARDLAALLLLAGVAVMAFLLLLFRRPLEVLLTLTPTLVGLICLLAVMRLTGQGLNMINLIALPLLCGIGVDDGIFVTTIARRFRAASPARLLVRLRASLHAMTVTSATTMVAFGSLTLTSTPAIVSLGWMAALGVGACLLATWGLLVPLLLMRRAVYGGAL